MHFTLGLFPPLLLSLFSPVFASPIDPSDSLPTKTAGNSGDPSQTWGAPGAAGSYYCVSPRAHADWLGTIKYDDCKAAYDAISNNLRNKDKMLTFWTEKYRPEVPPTPFESFRLPWGATRGKPFSQSLSAFDPFHSLMMTHSR